MFFVPCAGSKDRKREDTITTHVCNLPATHILYFSEFLKIKQPKLQTSQ